MKGRAFFPGLLRVLLVVAALACHAEEEGRSPANPSDQPDAAALLIATINASRGVPLRHDAVLQEVLQAYAQELSRQGKLPPSDVSQVLLGRLNDGGYRAYRVVVGFAQMSGSVAEIIAAWRRGDPGSFERFANPELRDFALGEGFVRGQTFYLAAAAVRQSEFYAAESADLRGDLEKTRQEELQRVNARRAEERLPPLRRHPALDLAAQRYAEDMLDRGFYGHFSPEGQDVGDRVKAARYAYRKVAENVASGQPSVAAVMQGWLESPDHLENLLDPNFTEIGIGFAAGATSDGSYRFLWVQVFGQPRR